MKWSHRRAVQTSNSLLRARQRASRLPTPDRYILFSVNAGLETYFTRGLDDILLHVLAVPAFPRPYPFELGLVCKSQV